MAQMITKLDKKIIEHIILAQCASDGGKDIFSDLWYSLGEKSTDAFSYGYQVKDSHIFAAISLIAASRGSSACHFYVKWLDEGRYLVYFNVKVPGGRRYQVSFHSFNTGMERYINKKGAMHETYWDKKSSRESCMALAELFFM